ncbi:CLUMA_CG015334, isoform A [Clunio marinus]|uniref:CLUMA_CG015334, isoform A n=1 Tax=Clunio marinus TaxID=568069 RepID=A0A1J1ITR2_9DIPT|nr:CLUMA_CG015334, isoform A [Clunio marinus]
MELRQWIRTILIIIYFIFLFIITPLIVWNTVKDGFEKKDQLILIGSLFVFCALPVSFFHFSQHLKHFNKPILQKHIIRIIMMIPVYSLDALFGLIYPRYSLYVDGLREIYEAYVIYNFMKYLLNYLNLEMDFVIAIQFKPQVYHFFPLCWMTPWRMGRELVHNCKHGILQYTMIRPLTTIVAIICELSGVYGESEFKFSVAYPYLAFINNLSQFCAMYCLVLFYRANYDELKHMKPLPKFLCIKAVVFFSFFQEVIINFLVYYGIIKDVFNSDIAKEGDYKLLASRLQNFLICVEMFLAALAHQYSFPYKPFQINDQSANNNWFSTFLAMLDMEDVRQDLSEHFGVVGDRIVGSFRSQPTYLQYSEADFLIPQNQSQQSPQVVTVSRVKDKNYGTYSSTQPVEAKSTNIGKNKKYRIANIEDKESSSSSDQATTSRNQTNNSNMTQSTTSTTSSFGINVRGLENDPINYRNPDKKMKINISLLLLLSSCLVFAPFITCETNDFDVDDGVTIEDESEQTAPIKDEVVEKIHYTSPDPDPKRFHFAEHFDELKRFEQKWVKSEAKKEDIAEEIAKYDGLWSLEMPQRSILDNDLGLVLKSKAKHAAIASRLNKPFRFDGKPLVVQYEVTLQDGQECGGSYIKLLSEGAETSDLKKFHDKTPYTIMFGPDKCGNDVKLHFIFRHVNPVNRSIEEKHSKKPKDRLEEPFKDKQPHLYKLVINPDNSFKVSVDHKVINEGHLLKDFNPAVNPPKEIDDPNDFKPETWDEREKIPDPTAVKPDDWDVPPQIPDPSASKPENWLDDEEEMIPDPAAEKPKDWDEEMDGVWEAPLIRNPMCEDNGWGKWEPPMIANPDYRGKWRAPLLDNPNYQGKWTPKRIPNPGFFEDNDPFARMTPISAVGIELWSMSSDILFDNIVITDDEIHAYEWAEKTYDLKRKHLDKQADTLWERMMANMNYSPGWYLTYFIYCMIPVVIYVWYLLSRRKDDYLIQEETFVQKMTKIVNESPWIVALVVVIVGLPISIILYMLCSSSPPNKGAQHSKKTDEPTVDDTPLEEELTPPPRPKSKLDLNEPEVEEVEDDDEDEVEDQKVVADTQTEEIALKSSSEPTSRKRKPRKE